MDIVKQTCTRGLFTLVLFATCIQAQRTINTMELDQKNRLLAAISTTNNDTTQLSLERYTTHGTRDATFANGEEVERVLNAWADIEALCIQPDGTILAAGSLNDGDHICAFVTRLLDNGFLDRSFASDGIFSFLRGSQTRIHDMALLPNHRAALVGSATIDGSVHALLFVLDLANVTGHIADTLVIGQYTRWDAITIDQHNNLVACGTAMKNGKRFGLLARYNSATMTLDTTFGADGLVLSNLTNDITRTCCCLDTQGRIILAEASSRSSLLSRYTPAGILDTNFAQDGVFRFKKLPLHLKDINTQPDNAIIVSGSIKKNEKERLCSARLLENGSLDATFANNGLFTLRLDDPSCANIVRVTQTDEIYLTGQLAQDTAMVKLDRHGNPDRTYGHAGLVSPTLDDNITTTILQEVQPAGTTAGPFLETTVTRELNAIKGNTNNVSLENAQFTLKPGYYTITAQAPACNVQGHQIALYSVTASKLECIGSSGYSGSSTTTKNAKNSYSELNHTIVVLTPTTFELRHLSEKTNANRASQGIAANTGHEEHYAQVIIEQH